MLLIVEIILTIVAWNKGWKAKSLIPLASSIVLGLFIGIILGSVGVTTIPLGVILIDLVAVVILIIMVVKPPVKVFDSGPPIKENTDSK